MNRQSIMRPLQVKIYGTTGTAQSQIEIVGLQNLGFRTEALNYELATIQAEAIRAALWMYSREGTKPVHINRFLRAAQRLMKPIWLYRQESAIDIADDGIDGETLPPLNSQIFTLHRPALNELERSGDIIKKPEGYWLPAPLRVRAYSPQRWQLHGGVPLYRLNEQARHEIVFEGTQRWLNHEPSILGGHWVAE